MSLAQARARLADRQNAVVAALLAGRTPEGFDPRGAAETSRVLDGKRASAARYARPLLGELLTWRTRFAAYGRQTSPAGCAHDDVDRFISWMAARDDLNTDEKDWLATALVYSGRRHIGWAGGRLRAIGLGSKVWRFGSQRKGEVE